MAVLSSVFVSDVLLVTFLVHGVVRIARTLTLLVVLLGIQPISALLGYTTLTTRLAAFEFYELCSPASEWLIK
jgi:hypothetical protein